MSEAHCELRAMPLRPSGRLLPGLVLLLATCLVASAGEAVIYKYVDRAGVTHYTDNAESVPFEYRDQVRDITAQMDELTGFNVLPRADGEGGDSAQESDLSVPFAENSEAGQMVEAVFDKLGFGFLILVLLALPVLYVVSALILKLSCRIAGEEPPGLGRACGILFAQGLAGMAVGGATNGIAYALGIDETASAAAALVLSGASSLLSWVASAAILSNMMSYGLLRSMWIGVLHTLLSLVLIAGPIAAVVGLVFLMS